MKQLKYLVWVVGIALFAQVSCTDNYESLPVDRFTEEFVFSTTDSTGKQARQFLNTIYEQLPNRHNGVGGDYLEAATDNALSIAINNEPDVYRLLLGRYTASNRVQSDMRWSDYYATIRKVNILIKNIDVVPFNISYTDAKGNKQPLNATMKAEARFLRAYFYFQLLERYGGVPLIGDKIFGLEDDLELKRNTFSECVDYIVAELDDIKDSLRSIPLENPEEFAHVATREAALALKVRVLLYAASPLFNGNSLEEGNELVGYPSYNHDRWKIAADAARSFMDTYGENGNNVFALAADFRKIFTSWYGGDNPELIFFRNTGNNTGVETANGPLGFSGTRLGNGRTNPSQNLVNAFLMRDGHLRGESPKYPYNPQRPYENRDPRLGYTVLHNGASWLGTQLKTYQGGPHNPAATGQYSRTSYYLRKFLGDFENADQYGNTLHLWVMFRYAEILLNFAEAENEYLDAPSGEVYEVITALRKRAGIEPGDDNMYGLKRDMTQHEMREVIRNERRIELAFEEHRYWDLRRWRIAEDVFSEPVKGMQIVLSQGNPSYQEVDLITVSFNERRYLYPIPYSEVNKNKNMVQNPKW
jgi:SusD family.